MASGRGNGGGDVDAGAMAVSALAFLAGDADRLGRFLAVSGVDPRQVRAVAARVDFQAGLLDYLLADEPLLMAFCVETGTRPEDVPRARRALAPGGEPE